jgi:hypothetical protein
MSIANWITILSVVVGAIVTLSVAYMHRKQMRQIELHRIDPNVPVVPPPHKVTVFLKRNWYFLYFLADGLFVGRRLIKHLDETTPVTREVVFDITIEVLALSALILMACLFPILRRAAETTGRMIGIMERTTETIIEMDKVVRPTAEKDKTAQSTPPEK